MSNQLPPPPSGAAWNPVGPYATSSMPLPTIRSLKGLATALTVLFILVALAEVVAASALFSRADLFDGVVNGDFITPDQGGDADDRVAAGILSHLVLFVGTAVVFIIWQFRHAKNAQVLGARGGLGPGWAIGGWFVPIGNYVLPAMQLHQSSRASDMVGRRQGGQGKGSGIVVLWAILFGIASITFVAGGGLAPADDEGNISIQTLEDVEDAASSDRTQAYGMVLYAFAALVGIGMVRSLTAKQAAAYAAMAEATAHAQATAASSPNLGETWGAASQGWAATPPEWGAPSPPAPPAPPPPAPPPPPAAPSIPPPPPVPPGTPLPPPPPS